MNTGTAMERAFVAPTTQTPARARWSDRWFNLRNRWLASRHFQRRAAAFPLTRPVARANASALFDLVAGFVYSQVLLACVRLDLFDILSEGAQPVATLVSRLGLSDPAARKLLNAAASLRLVERRSDDRFGLGMLGAPLVGNTAVLAMIEHHGALYADLADPVALLQGQRGPSQLGQYWPYAGDAQTRPLEKEDVAPYCALMAASQPLVADEILDAYDLTDHRCLLDIGGGDGTFLMRAGLRAPHLQLRLFDLPAVAALARTRIEAAGMQARAQATGGSFLHDALPRGADLATLVRVVHDHDDAQALMLLRAAYAALEPAGALLVAEPMADTAGAQAMGDAYFGFYLMAMGSGRPRSAAELTGLLMQAGFCAVEQVPTHLPMQTQVLLARKPGGRPRNPD